MKKLFSWPMKTICSSPHPTSDHPTGVCFKFRWTMWPYTDSSPMMREPRLFGIYCLVTSPIGRSCRWCYNFHSRRAERSTWTNKLRLELESLALKRHKTHFFTAIRRIWISAGKVGVGGVSLGRCAIQSCQDQRYPELLNLWGSRKP